MFRFLPSWEHRLQAHGEWGKGKRAKTSCLFLSHYLMA